MNNNPTHIALIMDGNNRWAKLNNQNTASGHHAGYVSLVKTIEEAVELKLEYVTVYAFSTENWKRGKGEIDALMKLLGFAFKKEISNLVKNNIRVRIIGNRSGLEKKLLDIINEAENLTKNNNGLNLTVAFNYGGRDEIIRAVNKILADKKDKINIDEFSQYLDFPSMPDPEIVIRTSGEHRTSNFLTWQSVYSELFFVDCLWPDFYNYGLKKVIDNYQTRNRRFGGR